MPHLTYAIQYLDETVEMRAPYLMLKAFVEAGWQVDIQTMAMPNNEAIDTAWGTVPIRKIEGGSRKAKILKLAASLLRRRRDQIVVSFIWEWHCFALLLAKLLLGSPYALALDTYTHRSGQTAWIRLRESWRYGRILRHADLIMAESPGSYEAAKKYAPQARVIHVPFCLWHRDLAAVENKWAHEKFSPDRAPVILYAGRLIPRKHIHTLITAFIRLAEKHPEWCLEIHGLPGSEAYYQQLQQQVTHSGWQQRIKILGPLSGEDLYRRYRETAVFALPSTGEGQPTVITEAMYFGGAIVAGISGAVSFQLENGACGLLHQPGNVDALSTHLDQLMQSEKVRQEYAGRARARMVSIFTWEQYFPQLADEFTAVLTD